VQELKERDLISRTNFCREFLIPVDEDEVHNLFMSVEADFHLRIHEQTFPLLDK
jgi:hypothetical protein